MRIVYSCFQGQKLSTNPFYKLTHLFCRLQTLLNHQFSSFLPIFSSYVLKSVAYSTVFALQSNNLNYASQIPVFRNFFSKFQKFRRNFLIFLFRKLIMYSEISKINEQRICAGYNYIINGDFIYSLKPC